MTEAAFTTELLESGNLLVGPWRSPKQMLHAQVYDSHASIHDDATAQKLGFQGGTIEGPTHFSQFAPLCERIWGQAWFETGCLSAHYRNPAFEGEEVQANIERPKPGSPVAVLSSGPVPAASGAGTRRYPLESRSSATLSMRNAFSRT